MAFDDSIMYIRTVQEEVLPSKDSDTKLLLSKLKRIHEWDFEFLGIGFCGTVYPMVRYNGKCFYSAEGLEAALKNMQPYRRRRFIEYFTPFECREPFIHKRSPIVVLCEKANISHIKVVWNARLKDYGFQKIFDPYQAFQQLEMFLGNLASPQTPIPKMTDVQKRDSHGFDTWSFKKR